MYIMWGTNGYPVDFGEIVTDASVSIAPNCLGYTTVGTRYHFTRRPLIVLSVVGDPGGMGGCSWLVGGRANSRQPRVVNKTKTECRRQRLTSLKCCSKSGTASRTKRLLEMGKRPSVSLSWEISLPLKTEKCGKNVLADN